MKDQEARNRISELEWQLKSIKDALHESYTYTGKNPGLIYSVQKIENDLELLMKHWGLKFEDVPPNRIVKKYQPTRGL
jgi:hypothetical protein